MTKQNTSQTLVNTQQLCYTGEMIPYKIHWQLVTNKGVKWVANWQGAQWFV